MKKIYIILFLTALSVISLYAQKESRDVKKGNKLYNKEKYTDAEIEYRKGLEKNSRSFEANYNLGNALFRQEKFEDAMTQYSSASNQTNDKEKIAANYHNLGNAFLSQNKVAESIDAYKTALKNNPKDDDTRYNLAYAQKLLKQQQEQQEQKQEQDKQEQEQQEQQNQGEQQQEENQQQEQQQEPQLSKENAQQLLDALLEDEKDVQEKVKKQKNRNPKKTEKDW